MLTLKVMADYGAQPLWLVGDPDRYNVAPSELSISAELCLELQAWADAYAATLNAEDPAASDFPSVEDEVQFIAKGRELAGRVKEELGSGYRVLFVHAGAAGTVSEEI